MLSYFPPTPPDMRVRIRRFSELRLEGAKPRHSERSKYAPGRASVQSALCAATRHQRSTEPTPPSRRTRRETPRRSQLAVQRPALASTV